MEAKHAKLQLECDIAEDKRMPQLLLAATTLLSCPGTLSDPQMG